MQPNSELRALLSGKVATATDLTDETVKSVQKIASELRSGVLDQLGLAAAIKSEAQSFQARTGIRIASGVFQRRCRLRCPCRTGDGHIRIFQEILTNIARHAHATEVIVRLSLDNGQA